MAVAFHSATSAQGNPVTSLSFALPTISAGDVILLWVAWNTAAAVTISGAGTWTHQGPDGLISGQLQMGLWTAVSAAGSESGQNVTINVGSQEKFAAVAASYSGVDNTTPLQSGPTYATSTTGSTTSATSPSTSPSPSSWVLQAFTEKSTTNASYTTPSGTTSRQQVFGTGGGAIDLALFDSNAAVSSGGGQTTTAGTSATNHVAGTVVLNAATTGFTGSGAVTETATISGSGGGTGAGSVSETASIFGAGSANYTGTGSQTVTASISGTAGGTGAGAVTASAAIAGTGKVTGSGSVTGTATIAGSGKAVGSGAVTVTASITGAPSGALSGAGSLAATAAVSGTGQSSGFSSVAASATIAGSGAVGIVGSGSLTVTAAITGSPPLSYVFNDAEDGTNGTAVAAATGTTTDGSLRFGTVTAASGSTGTLTYDNSQPIDGSLSFLVTFDSAGRGRYAYWDNTQTSTSAPLYQSQLVKLPSLPSATLHLAQFRTSTSAQCMVRVNASGNLELAALSGVVKTSTTVVPTGAPFRVELALLVNSSTVGQIEARLFTNPYSTTPDETLTSAATLNTSGTTTQITTGQTSGPASYSYRFDQFRASATGYPPPPVSPALSGSGTLTAAATITGSGATGYTNTGTVSASATIAGSGNLPTANSGTVSAFTTVTGSGVVSGAGALTATASIAGDSKTTATAAVSITANIAGVGAVVATTYVPRTATSGSGNNQTVITALPTGVVAGDLLICHLSVAQGGTSFTQPIVNTPSGWLPIPSGSTANPLVSQGTNAGIVGAWYYRWATGTDPAPSWTFNTGSVFFKNAWVIEAYSGGPGSGAPSLICGPGATGTATLTNTAPTTNLSYPAWYAETYASRSGVTANTSYSITGPTVRGSAFGTGGSPADVLLVDSNGSASGPVGGDTATANQPAGWQVHGLIVLPTTTSAGVSVSASITGSGSVSSPTGSRVNVAVNITAIGAVAGVVPQLFVAPVVHVTYTIQLVDAPHLGTSSAVISDLEQASGKSLTWSTPEGSQLTWTMPGDHPESLLYGGSGIPGLWEMCTDAIFWRDAGQGPVKLWRGRVTGGTDQHDGNAYTVPWTAVDYKALFASKLLFDGDTLTFAASTDVAAIFWSLVSTVQGRTNGNLGIAKSLDGWDGSGTANTGKTFGASFVVTPGTDLKSALDTLLAGDTSTPAGAAAGFDWWIDADLKAHIKSRNQTSPNPPGRGTASTFVADFQGTVAQFTRTPLVDQYGNVFRGDGGTGTTPVTVSSPTVTTDPAGRVERAVQVSVDTTQTTAQQNALVSQVTAEALYVGNLPASSFGLTLTKGVWDPSVLGVGDNVQVQNLPGRLSQFDGLQRVLSLQIDASDDGDEVVTLTTNRPDVSNWQTDALVKLGERVRGLELRQ